MDSPCIQKLIKKLRCAFEDQIGKELTSFSDPKFGSWLQENDPIGEIEDRNQYVILEQKLFAKAIMGAYVESINQIAKVLDTRKPEKTYSKTEVLDLISDAFGIAKAEGETKIKKVIKF